MYMKSWQLQHNNVEASPTMNNKYRMILKIKLQLLKQVLCLNMLMKRILWCLMWNTLDAQTRMHFNFHGAYINETATLLKQKIISYK